MSDYFVYYERVSPTTWVYLSSLLMISLYFKFNRLWSVRNLDLIGLILLAPLVCCLSSTDKNAGRRPTNRPDISGYSPSADCS